MQCLHVSSQAQLKVNASALDALLACALCVNACIGVCVHLRAAACAFLSGMPVMGIRLIRVLSAAVWSAGVMLYVMIFCKYPFERREDEGDPQRFQKVLQRIQRVCLYPCHPLANAVCNLVCHGRRPHI